MKPFRKPDLNAPRYRPQVHQIIKKEFFARFREENPAFAYLTDDEMETILVTFHGIIWQTVIDHRDGVELMEQLGNIFIGACPKKKNANPDFVKSAELGYVVQHQNWESDQYTAKIFYTNRAAKYRFRFHEIWGFDNVRQFKRTVSKIFPEKYTYYHFINNKKQKVKWLVRKPAS